MDVYVCWRVNSRLVEMCTRIIHINNMRYFSVKRRAEPGDNKLLKTTRYRVL